MKAFDTHCHLAGTDLMPLASKLLGEALQNEVGGVAIISADAPSLRDAPKVAAQLKKEHPRARVCYSAGIHPHEAKDMDDTLWQELVNLAQNAAAIGETGLDFYYNHSEAELQNRVFRQHIELSAQLQKPLIVHCRNSIKEILQALDCQDIRNHRCPGILHCFSEDWESAKRLLDLNFYISFSGIVTFKNASSLREVVKQVPLDRLLIETDAPWLAPVPHRGKQNAPAYVMEVLKTVQQLRPEDPLVVQSQLVQNSLEVFGFDD